MSAHRDRDTPTDRLIEAALRQRPAGAPDRRSPACPDPELLAAFVERRLASDEVGHLEAHLADCTRCQQSLATLVRALPVLEPASEPGAGWQTWLPTSWRWAVPATVAAALVAVWVANRGPAATPTQPETTIAEVLRPAQGTAPEMAEQVGPGEPAARRSHDLADTERGDIGSSKAELERGPALAADGQKTPAPGGQAPSERLDSTAEKRGAPKEAGTAVAVADLPAAAPPPPAAAAPATPVAKEAAAATVAQRVESDAVSPAEEKAASAPLLPTRRAQETGRRALASRASEIVAPDGTVRWRFGFGGMLFKSANGMTWDRQETGTTLDLLSGSAVSASTCWMVGREGLVLVTTDGDTWQRVPFPEIVDLVEVVANDAGSATVTASDGRRFGTADAGRTWTLLP